MRPESTHAQDGWTHNVGYVERCQREERASEAPAPQAVEGEDSPGHRLRERAFCLAAAAQFSDCRAWAIGLLELAARECRRRASQAGLRNLNAHTGSPALFDLIRGYC